MSKSQPIPARLLGLLLFSAAGVCVAGIRALGPTTEISAFHKANPLRSSVARARYIDTLALRFHSRRGAEYRDRRRWAAIPSVSPPTGCTRPAAAWEPWPIAEDPLLARPAPAPTSPTATTATGTRHIRVPRRSSPAGSPPSRRFV